MTTAKTTVTVRIAQDVDSVVLQDIQLASGAPFRDIGMADIADNPPLPAETLDEYQQAGRALVAVDGDRTIGFAVFDVVDGCAHIEQISVHPDYARRGIGRTMLDRIAVWATEQGLASLTLTTFRDVCWNAPYYERCGFRNIPDDEITPELAEIIAAEIAFGLDPATRVAMRRQIG